MISQAQLRELLDYDPETGVFTWRHRNDARPEWNTRWAGAVAGAVTFYGYRTICIDNGIYRAARLAWLYVFGAMPPHKVDHIDHDRLNDRIANLREATNTENMRNRPAPKSNTSGFKGVSWHRQRGKWAAQIFVDGQHISLGLHERAEDASAAYEAAAAQHFGKFHFPSSAGSNMPSNAQEYVS